VRINPSSKRRTALACKPIVAPASSGTAVSRAAAYVPAASALKRSPAGTAASHVDLPASRKTSSTTASHGSHSGRWRFRPLRAVPDAIIGG
jgi:hypothetical protein